MGISIGGIALRNRVFLAPMSGVSDEPFRRIAHAWGAGLVVSEMVASEELVKARPEMVRRARGAGRIAPFAVQLAGREARWMAEGARAACDLGADLIDINMGCPARKVTGGLSGSALMRDLDHAERLIAATVGASKVPVTLKMRLGWDAAALNAPELAHRAAGAGVALVTVHGRTRCQFYDGKADWRAIRAVKAAVRIPVIANGDCASLDDARTMLSLSGADGIMVGRASYGRPWWPGVLAERLEPGSGATEPDLMQEARIIRAHHQAMLRHYGAGPGNRAARKHLGWVVARQLEAGRLSGAQASRWRERLLTTADHGAVARGLREFYLALTAAAA